MEARLVLCTLLLVALALTGVNGAFTDRVTCSPTSTASASDTFSNFFTVDDAETTFASCPFARIAGTADDDYVQITCTGPGSLTVESTVEPGVTNVVHVHGVVLLQVVMYAGDDWVLTDTSMCEDASWPSIQMNGNDGGDVLEGGGSDDTISGGAGRDVLFGKGGNDVLNADGGPASFMDGGDGHDTINGNSGADICSGGPGSDRLNGYDGYDALYGGQTGMTPMNDIDTMIAMMDALSTQRGSFNPLAYPNWCDDYEGDFLIGGGAGDHAVYGTCTYGADPYCETVREVSRDKITANVEHSYMFGGGETGTCFDNTPTTPATTTTPFVFDPDYTTQPYCASQRRTIGNLDAGITGQVEQDLLYTGEPGVFDVILKFSVLCEGDGPQVYVDLELASGGYHSLNGPVFPECGVELTYIGYGISFQTEEFYIYIYTYAADEEEAGTYDLRFTNTIQFDGTLITPSDTTYIINSFDYQSLGELLLCMPLQLTTLPATTTTTLSTTTTEAPPDYMGTPIIVLNTRRSTLTNLGSFLGFSGSPFLLHAMQILTGSERTQLHTVIVGINLIGGSPDGFSICIVEASDTLQVVTGEDAEDYLPTGNVLGTLTGPEPLEKSEVAYTGNFVFEPNTRYFIQLSAEGNTDGNYWWMETTAEPVFDTALGFTTSNKYFVKASPDFGAWRYSTDRTSMFQLTVRRLADVNDIMPQPGGGDMMPEPGGGN